MQQKCAYRGRERAGGGRVAFNRRGRAAAGDGRRNRRDGDCLRARGQVARAIRDGVGDVEAVVGVDRGQRDAVVGVDSAAVGVGGARSGGRQLRGLAGVGDLQKKVYRHVRIQNIIKRKKQNRQRTERVTEQQLTVAERMTLAAPQVTCALLIAHWTWAG